MAKLDDNQAHLLELTAELTERAKLMRDYATTPGNAWLAKGELNKLGQLISELELLVEEIKQSEPRSD